jgi:hypothetical protein
MRDCFPVVPIIDRVVIDGTASNEHSSAGATDVRPNY